MKNERLGKHSTINSVITMSFNFSITRENKAECFMELEDWSSNSISLQIECDEKLCREVFDILPSHITHLHIRLWGVFQFTNIMDLPSNITHFMSNVVIKFRIPKTIEHWFLDENADCLANAIVSPSTTIYVHSSQLDAVTGNFTRTNTKPKIQTFEWCDFADSNDSITKRYDFVVFGYTKIIVPKNQDAPTETAGDNAIINNDIFNRLMEKSQLKYSENVRKVAHRILERLELLSEHGLLQDCSFSIDVCNLNEKFIKNLRVYVTPERIQLEQQENYVRVKIV